MFCDNLKIRMDALGMTAKDVANHMEKSGFSFRRAKKPHRIVESWTSKTRPYHPELLTAVALAKVLHTTVEELVDGEAGAEYVRRWARKEGGLWEPPPRVAGVMAILNGLDDDELAVVIGAMRGVVQGLEDTKRGDRKATGTSTLVG
jgi:predicted RNA binding protein YcfA (HicA-like mRNA interferase family)